MNYWLYSEILKVEDIRNPQFARTSTLNWMKALKYELYEHLGPTPTEQFHTLIGHFNTTLNRGYNAREISEIFEPLYSCLTYAQTLLTRSKFITYETWTLPSSIVEWYYCWYNAIRAMVAAFGQNVADHHAAVYKFYASSLFRIMPHPLNMYAQHVRNEEYEIITPSFPDQTSFDLNKAFPGNRDAARGMLHQYLIGTAKFYTWKTKDDILKRSKFQDFRTKEAKSLRDSRIDKFISFMHCAYRYRGKANYRDGIYLTYGQINSDDNIQLIHDLADSAKTAFLIAFSFVYSTSLREYTGHFIEDVNRNLRGIDSLEDEDKFWNVL